MVTAVATPALAAATRAFAREPRACKTLIAADFGSKTRGSARAPATRAALGARAGARAATHVLRARVAGGTEWNDEANSEENDDEETEQLETRRAANDDIQSSDSEVGFENGDPSALGGSFSSDEKDVHDDARDERRDAATNDENWLDDEQYGCSPGQLWVNAIACIGATQNPKHAFHASEFLEKTIRRRSVSPEVSPNVYENDAMITSFPDEFVDIVDTTRHAFDPECVLNAWRENSDARAAELRFVIEHPTLFCAASLGFCFLCFSVSRRRAKTKALKASLLNDGVDLTNVFGDHLETLEYLHLMRDKNALALGIETCAARKVETETRYLGVAALRDWREFYGSRGIDLATKDDVKKVKAYVDNLHHLEGCLLGKGRGEKSKPLGEEW